MAGGWSSGEGERRGLTLTNCLLASTSVLLPLHTHVHTNKEID